MQESKPLYKSQYIKPLTTKRQPVTKVTLEEIKQMVQAKYQPKSKSQDKVLVSSDTK